GSSSRTIWRRSRPRAVDTMTAGRMSIARLQQMKRDGRKIVAVVAYEYQMAAIADRAGVDMLSVGDSVGINLWGHRSELEVTLDQMILACRAVRRGAERALVSCDFPFGPLQQGPDAAVRAAIPVWAQFGITPHTALKYGGMANAGPDLATQMKDRLVDEARLLEASG